MFIESKERKNAVCALLTFPKVNIFYDEKNSEEYFQIKLLAAEILSR